MKKDITSTHRYYTKHTWHILYVLNCSYIFLLRFQPIWFYRFEPSRLVVWIVQRFHPLIIQWHWFHSYSRTFKTKSKMTTGLFQKLDLYSYLNFLVVYQRSSKIKFQIIQSSKIKFQFTQSSTITAYNYRYDFSWM